MLAGLAAIFALPFAVYWRSLSDFFMLDDFIWLKAAAGHDFFDLMGRETSFSTPLDPFDYPTPFIRPLVDAYFFATYRIFGFDPGAYHALNLVLHSLAGLVVAVLGWQLTRSRLTGFAAACLFLALPTYDYAVTWVSEVTDLLFSFFYLLSLAFFIAHVRGSYRRPNALYAASLAAFTLALLSKEPAITLVAVLGLVALIETPVLTRESVKPMALSLGPFAALALVFYLGVYRREYDTISGGGAYELDSRVFGHYWDYLKWLSFPFKPDSELSLLRGITAASFVVLGLWSLVRRDRVLSFLFLWTLVCLGPLSLFAHGIDRRYAYLVAVPFALFLVVGLKPAFERLGDVRLARFALAATVLIAMPFLIVAVRSNQSWAHEQARFYQQIYEGVPKVCGPLAPGARIVLIDSPAFELAGIDSQVALNFSYNRVAVERYGASEMVPASAVSQTTCTARWTRSGFSKE